MALGPFALAPVASDIYTLAVGDWTQADPDQEIGEFGSVSISFNLDSGCECTFDVPGNSPSAKVLSELASDVWLYQGGSVAQRFRIVAVEQTWDADGGDVVAVTAVCYKRLMNARHVQSALSYSSVAQATIIWNLIAHTQAQPGGDLGITQGTLDSGGINRDRSYSQGENIGKVLSDLSNVIDGPTWSIDGLRKLNVVMLSSFPNRFTPVELGATARTLTRGSGAAEFANSVYVDGDNAATSAVITDSTDILTDPRGRWERAAGFPNVVLQQTLVEKSQGLIEELRTPLAQWSCEIEPARYLIDANFAPGDFVDIVVPATVAAPIGNPGFSIPAQVMNVALTLDGDGLSTVSLEAVEVPVVPTNRQGAFDVGFSDGFDI